MTDDHLQKSANSQMGSCINITPNDKYPSHNPNSGYSFKQDTTDDFIQHKHKTEHKHYEDNQMSGMYQHYPAEYVQCKLAENPSQDLAEKTDDA